MQRLQVIYSLISICCIRKVSGFKVSLKYSLTFITLVATTYQGFSQVSNALYGSLLTKTSNDGSSADTMRLLYCRNVADNKLTAYNISGGVVSSATAYYLSGSKNNLYLYSRSIDQNTTDSLKIDFNDNNRQVIINRHDRYTLFPNAYLQLKTEVQQNHKITAIINLLYDTIGDYPVADALPLFAFQPPITKQICSANIITKRNQSDLTDKWTVTYKYNLQGLLQQVTANADKDIRFTKTVQYSAQKAKQITTYLNIESRQIVRQKISYAQNQPFITWTDDNYETGKDRETKISIKLIAGRRIKLQRIEPTFKEALSLVKATH